jgi:hypothetical protein
MNLNLFKVQFKLGYSIPHQGAILDTALFKACNKLYWDDHSAGYF